MTAREATAGETDLFMDRQLLDTGLSHDRARLPKAADVLALSFRLTLWEAMMEAAALVEAHNGTHFTIAETVTDDEAMRTEWALSLHQGNRHLTSDALDEACLEWTRLLTEAVIVAVPGRLSSVVLNSSVSPDQINAIQDLIFGSGMVAVWREHRTPAFEDQPMLESSAKRPRNRP